MSGRRRSAPPAEHRFRKGQSGNPKGRPRKAKERNPSAFEVVLEKSLAVTIGGKIHELTVEEALQHKTYQDALAGNRSARREVLKMIAKREKWLADKAPARKPFAVEVRMDRSGLQRRGPHRVQAAHQCQRRASHGELREDADVHAVDDEIGRAHV